MRLRESRRRHCKDVRSSSTRHLCGGFHDSLFGRFGSAEFAGQHTFAEGKKTGHSTYPLKHNVPFCDSNLVHWTFVIIPFGLIRWRTHHELTHRNQLQLHPDAVRKQLAVR